MTIIPSRKRPFNVARMRTFFPDAAWWVNELEADTYLKAGVPEQLLWRHTCPQTYASVANGLMDEAVRRDEDCITIADDDIEDVWCVPSNRKLAPDEVRVIVDNMQQLLVDLDLVAGSFCYQQSVRAFGGNHAQPFRFMPVIHGLWVLRGTGLAGRRYRLDMGVSPDLDWSLRALLEDRVMLADERYVINLGKTFNNPGGNTGLISSTQQDAAIKRHADVWGGAIQLDPRGLTASFNSRMRRRNPRAPRL